MLHTLVCCGIILGLVCQKQVSRAGTSNYIPQYLWDVIICPCSIEKTSAWPIKLNAIQPTLRSPHVTMYSWGVIIFTRFENKHNVYSAVKHHILSVTSGLVFLPTNQILTAENKLTHCGLVMPYGDTELGKQWLRQWLVACWHHSIIWTNVGLSSVRSSDIHLRAIF